MPQLPVRFAGGLAAIALLAAAAVPSRAAAELRTAGPQRALIGLTKHGIHEVELAAGPDGYVATWSRNNVPGVFARRYDADGRPAGNAIRVDGPSELDFWSLPDVAMADDGSFAVVWHSVTDRDVHARAFDPADAPLSSDQVVNVTRPHWQLYPRVAADPQGGYVVGWTTGNVGDDGVRWPHVALARRLDARGRPVGAEARLNGRVAADADWIEVVIGSDRDVLAVWQRCGRGCGPAGPAVVARRLDAVGDPQTADLGVGVARLGHTDHVSACALPAGRFLVAWADGQSRGVSVRSVGADGARGPRFSIAVDGVVTHGGPQLACDASGRALLVFGVGTFVPGQGGSFDHGSVLAQELDVNGRSVGPTIRVDPVDGLLHSAPRVAIAPDGRALVTWLATRPGDGMGLRGRIVTVAP
jgi:hypothetical protein